MSFKRLEITYMDIYRMFQEEVLIFWEFILSFILSKKLFKYMCPIPNGFRGRAISYYLPNKGKSKCSQTSNTP
jgi:hypothetical protein